ncbi:penicillin-binding protein [Tumebacillus algifaecis]|uniref:Penicillin-binding protein n=1 Tax=Tumebacillus algifaecis TaxID=1214604 RepID=A0A223D4H4_9BACL|nr:serine hydrolase domain-containing protein [Tumebacillus algifaecis]ASS76482.1 penicillin-binding protein [Tumebacillus algifaecis]
MQLETKQNGRFEKLAAYVEQINHLNGGSGSALLVIQRDEIVMERYAGFHSHAAGARKVTASSQFNVASARKSYIGLAAAWAIYAGKLGGLDDLVLDYLPEYDDDLLQGTTIRHLVTHTHGLHADADGKLYREFAPGSSWAYRGVNVVMMTEIIRRATGKTVAEILQDTVFGPLGFTETGWRTEATEQLVSVILDRPEETELVLGTDGSGDGMQRNLFVSAREFAMWGYLHLTRGRVNGRQVVPAELVRLATEVQSPELSDPDLPSIGCFWYVQDRQALRSEIGSTVPKGSYQILGVTGPALLVVPEEELVVVRMCNKRYNYSGPDGDYLHYLREFGDCVMRCVR